MIKFKKIHDDSQVPALANESDAGFDLYAYEFSKPGSPQVWVNPCHRLEPGESVCVNTGVAVSVGDNKVGIIKPRSGLAAKHSIDVLGGVIDSGYTGELKVLLINHGDTFIQLEKGMRIAQLVVFMNFTKSEVVEDLQETDRSDKGFGSTGK